MNMACLSIVPNSKEDLNLSVISRYIHGESYLNVFDESVACYVNKNWKKCLELSDILLHITWEHLNTGYWKDIHISWRYTYTYGSLLKAVSLCLCNTNSKDDMNLREAIKTCDMGLLLGAPILDNILARLVEVLQNQLVVDKEPVKKRYKINEEVTTSFPQLKNPVHSLSLPSIEHFKTNFMDKCEPLLITDSMTHWPALNKWNIEYLKETAGCRTVPIEIGSKYTEESWSQKLMLLSEFIERFINFPTGSQVGYLAQHELFDQIPELQSDINIPTYCSLGEEDVDINAWFGPKGTVSPLHHDPKHNFLCQVVGEKYIKLYREEDTQYVYPHSSEMLFNTSQVDVEKPDLNQYPDFVQAVAIDCVLKPGEMLYIPPRCWHYVRSLSTSFSVSFWWK